MKKTVAIFVLIMVFAGAWYFAKKPLVNTKPASPVKEERVWQIKSIDTMKYSRDLSGQALGDSTFDTTIDTQVRAIAATGANTVAIATPYDEKFVPVLARWVAAARRYDLHVWFRGNFSAWEGWFGQDSNLTREEHIKMTQSFIEKNPNIFADGDYFSPCPECENGGPGDPRNGDVSGFRKFMVDEKQACDDAFKKIGKDVNCGLWSMNMDVAKLVMDPETAKAMGGVVVIDHYVKTTEKLVGDINALAKQTDAKIFLGEFGAPIPDIHGKMTDQEQADWLEAALLGVSKDPQVIGLNYWTSFGGSTAIFNDDNSPKLAVSALTKYFKLQSLPN
ncbi:MAG: hypothetical protein UT84_C0005G0011 [Candidatus Curtissbacteria bacterium GW2011_GWA1_40_16]|uniref:Glycoside hydrolase family 5 domain-containing protein n=1 Tax=Candidatus Curtissbacteria bacterium GW2011_GWA1_40_16 TaxID=1618405 RepID=A0A0G0TUU9_9BACT|nr:MAG: hypothetical protein UT84_C0005G0011 [Candidatus Curtissbacteria bacterium GW2011_GWA1_40_16]